MPPHSLTSTSRDTGISLRPQLSMVSFTLLEVSTWALNRASITLRAFLPNRAKWGEEEHRLLLMVV